MQPLNLALNIDTNAITDQFHVRPHSGNIYMLLGIHYMIIISLVEGMFVTLMVALETTLLKPLTETEKSFMSGKSLSVNKTKVVVK